MNVFRLKYAPVIFLLFFLGIIGLPFLAPGPTNEMVEYLVREANKDRDVRVESVEILAYGDKKCDNTDVLRPCRWTFKVQVVKHFNPGNGETIQLVHQKTVEITLEERSMWHCIGCYTGLASEID